MSVLTPRMFSAHSASPPGLDSKEAKDSVLRCQLAVLSHVGSFHKSSRGVGKMSKSIHFIAGKSRQYSDSCILGKGPSGQDLRCFG